MHDIRATSIHSLQILVRLYEMHTDDRRLGRFREQRSSSVIARSVERIVVDLFSCQEIFKGYILRLMSRDLQAFFQ